MIIKITADNISMVKNPVLREYMTMYTEMYDKFLLNVAHTGIQIDTTDYQDEITAEIKELKAMGITVRNNGKSLVYGHISGACLDCHTGKGTATSIISLQCNRDCYFCANKNQLDYAASKNTVRDIIKDFDKCLSLYGQMSSVAVTGGEPLLFADECAAFISHVKKTDPDIQVRIYSNGDLANKSIISKLAKAGLDEIRIGIKLDDYGQAPADVMENIQDMVGVIPRVMVEMPVVPGTLDVMKDLLDTLNTYGIFGINILEFLYPFNHADDFTRKGYKVSKRPYQILYGYTYAGGLPVSGSELECLRLLKHAAQQKYTMGVHYCSLENKLTSQIWHQNNQIKKQPYEYSSPNDFFVKSALACGEDAEKIAKKLKKSGCYNYQFDSKNQIIDFSVHDIFRLKSMDIEVGLSYRLLESQYGEMNIREVAINLVDINIFDINKI